jgi:plastocyanin
MKRPFALIVVSVLAVIVTAKFEPRAAAQGSTGTITGHVKLSGPSPGNPMIRMGMDPMCAKLNAGKRIFHEFVVVNDSGGLANAFVDLTGSLPNSAAPSAPVVLEQKNCVYTPRVVGARVGGTLHILSDDPLVHNVHSVSLKNPFNFSEAKAGISRDITVKGPDVMMKILCDIHSWMVSYVGVETHPFYAVSAADGSFKIANVPPGKHTVRIWHERFGQLTKTVSVTAGGTATVDFAYTGKEKPSTGRIQDLTIPSADASLELRLVAGE